MRLVKKSISAKDGEGQVTLCPGDAEDMWHSYNLISIGDAVTATTIRKVVRTGATAVQSQRIRITLTVRVLAVDFDPQECSIRLAGQNIRENEHVKLGAHHTVELEPHRNFSIAKERWDTIFLERLETACNPVKQAQLAAVVMQPGLAHVCLITGHMTLVRAKVEKSVPKKRAGGKSHDDAMKRFFELIVQALAREVDFEIVKAVILGSPGYTKDDFFKYMLAEAEKRPDLRHLLKRKDQFLLVHTSSGYKHALDQVMGDPGIQSQLADTQAAKEVAVLHKFFRMLNDNSEKAFYSFPHVRAAQDKGAIASLLVTDSLFRSSDIKTRKRYVQLVEDCRGSGANVYIFSALHTSGEQLEQLSGVAAILRYPLPELDELEIEPEQPAEAGREDPMAAFMRDNPDDDDADDGFEDDEDGDGNNLSVMEAAEGAGLGGANAGPHLTHDQEDAKAILHDLF